MLKHVSTSSHGKLNKYDSIGRVDTISLNSSVSSNDSSVTDSSCDPVGSPSRSSSSSSIHYIESQKIVIKIFTKVLCSDVEYKTLSVHNHITCKEIVRTILAKFRLKNRDPNLFYLTLEAWIKQTGIPIRSVMTLEDDACPALLQSCYTQKDLKFTLMMRRGSIVKIYDTCLRPGSLYTNLLVSERTTVGEVIQLLLHNADTNDSYSDYELYECSPPRNAERKLAYTDLPVVLQADWPNPDFNIFQLRSTKILDNHKKKQSFTSILNNTVYNFKRNLKTEFTFNLINSSTNSNKSDKLFFI